VTDRTELFLGIIAVATLLMAIVQIGAVIAAGLMARRLSRLVDQLEQDVRPLIGHLNAVTRDASRVVSLSAIQAERADQLFADVCKRAEQTLNTVQTTIETPFREGRALLNAFRAGLDAIRARRQPPPKDGPPSPGYGEAGPPRREDDEALFI
jgi:hypothetical protein